jgi:hypothetical protein
MKKIVILLCLLFSVVSFGKTTYFQIGLTPELKLANAEKVTGVRVPIFFGTTEKVTGVDFNLFTSEVDEFTGVSGGIFLGAGIFTKVNTKFRGIGLNIATLQGGDSKGVLLGGFNMTNNFSGFKLGLFNYSKEHASVEVAIINYSNDVLVQGGLINITKNLRGVQFGLLNFAENGILPVMPFINFGCKKKDIN